MRDKTTPNTLVRESIIDIMPQEGCFEVPQIRELLQKEKGLIFGKDYTEGNISNALYVLSNSGFLTKPKRGVYQKAPLQNNDAEGSGFIPINTNPEAAKISSYETAEILNLFRKHKHNLKQIYLELYSSLKNINLCNGATDEEFKELKEALDFKNAFAELLERFEI